MESRRTTRNRASTKNDMSPTTLTAKRSSPVRRSSRPRSTVPTSKIVNIPITIEPRPAKEKQDVPAQTTKKSSSRSRSNFPTTLTTNTSTRAPNKAQTTASVDSSYSSSTIEIRSTNSANERSYSSLSDAIRRSVPKFINANEEGEATTVRRRGGTHTPTTTTDVESRNSRSVSRLSYREDSLAKFSDATDDQRDDLFESVNATQPTYTSASLLQRRFLRAPREFGGWLGVTLLMLLVPCLVYYLQWSCVKPACNFRAINLSVLYDAKYIAAKLVPTEAVVAYVAYISCIFLLSSILPGLGVRLPIERGNVEYKFNVLSIAVVLTIGAAIAEYLGYAVADFVLKHYLRFCVYGFVHAFVATLWCYIRPDGMYKRTLHNFYGNTGNFLIDYALGREINPNWFNLVDYKQFFYRISLISTLVFAECFIYKNLQFPFIPMGKEGFFNIAEYIIRVTKYDAPAMLAATLLLLYILDAIIFEHHLASSFELQGEGFGCLLLLRYFATPYLLSAVAKYFFDRRTTASIACSFAIGVAFILLAVGLIIKRFSSAVKYKYRLNPTNAYFYGMNNINTAQGRRLLLGGFWGRVRQPNYVGDILALIALGVPIFLRFAWPPLISLLLIIALLLHRAVRVNERNAEIYQSSWSMYRRQVPYYFVPKIF